MGQFSWLDCVSGKQIVDDKVKDVYVLIPKEFGGGYIVEHCYDGYGNFGGYDIYDLVATWNREYLSLNPNLILRKSKNKICDYDWYEFYRDLNLSEKKVSDAITFKRNLKYPYKWRSIGIDLACYDEDNASLLYPIKITYNANAIYEHCVPSNSDPNQGWEDEDEDNKDDWFYRR